MHAACPISTERDGEAGDAPSERPRRRLARRRRPRLSERRSPRRPHSWIARRDPFAGGQVGAEVVDGQSGAAGGGGEGERGELMSGTGRQADEHGPGSRLVPAASYAAPIQRATAALAACSAATDTAPDCHASPSARRAGNRYRSSSARRTRACPSRPGPPAGRRSPWPRGRHESFDELAGVSVSGGAPSRTGGRWEIRIRDVPQGCGRGARCPALVHSPRIARTRPMAASSYRR